MSPAFVSEPYQLSTSTSSSSQGNSTTALISLVLVKILKLVLASFLGENNIKKFRSDEVDVRNDFDSERVDSYQGMDNSLIDVESLDDNNRSFDFRENRGNWTFLNFFTDAVQLVLNKYSIDKGIFDKKTKRETFTSKRNYLRRKRHYLQATTPKTGNLYTSRTNTSGATISSKFEFSFELPLRSWRILR